MPLSKDKQKILDKICASGDDEIIFSDIKEKIESDDLTAEDIFFYTDYQFDDKGKKRYALSSKVINKFGVFIGKKSDSNEVKFYQLAAERGSSYGNENYAKCLLLKGKYSEALPFAERAVELTKALVTERHQHKLTLWKLLLANKRDGAYDVLRAYVDSLSLPKAEEFYQTCINDLESEFDEFVANDDNDDEDAAKTLYIWQLIYLIDKSQRLRSNGNVFYALKQKLYFLRGQYAEKLDDTEEAWRSYCGIYDKTSSVYPRAIEAKIRLLKDKIRILLIPIPVIEKLKLSDASLSEENKMIFDDCDTLLSPIKLHDAWKKEDADWFNSVNVLEVEDHYNSRISLLQKSFDEASTAVNNNIKEKLVKKYYEKGFEYFMLLSEEERKTIISNLIDTSEEIPKPEDSLVIQREKIKKLKSAVEEKKKVHLPEYKKTHRRYLAEKHFFNPQRSKKHQELIALTDHIINQRYQINQNNALPEIDLSGKSSRLFITAERIYQEAILALNGEYPPNLGIPRAREKQWKDNPYWNGPDGSTGYGPVEKYKVDTSVTKSEHRTSPKRKDRLGDSFLPQYGAYSKDIYPFLNKLCKKDITKEKQLATWMIRYGRNHQSVSVDELQTLYTTATQSDVDSFNHICFLLMEKEQMQWHCAVEAKYLLGMSVAQARAIILIKEGYLCFEEVFENEVFFGVYSQKELLDHPERVKNACEHIEAMYTAYLQTKYAPQHLAFFKRTLKEKVNPEVVLTRWQAHQDLKTVYGGDSDTENEGYESDLSFS